MKKILVIVLLFLFQSIGYAELLWTDIPCEREFEQGLIPPEQYPEDNEICGSPKYTIVDTSDFNEVYNLIVKEVLCYGEYVKYHHCKVMPKVVPIDNKKIKFAEYCGDTSNKPCYITFEYKNKMKDKFYLGVSAACIEGDQDEFIFERVGNKIKITKWYFSC
ncbi:hypothetical protein LS68_004545 [Helicobacter sp. MIT 05-5293]|uniref:hypothetical protein n=1 Tax=Helicobacter sp. MIT 05-5293 TaxID=1548149 RepID=UPI00051DAE02|nr:hypothetical protein [Helicobacter sp. MIT 05-5293]TLD82264.1 hypothetical protein LS68_004545 [Helicobacter sp. MIT 05-5293]